MGRFDLYFEINIRLFKKPDAIIIRSGMRHLKLTHLHYRIGIRDLVDNFRLPANNDSESSLW